MLPNKFLKKIPVITRAGVAAQSSRTGPGSQANGAGAPPHAAVLLPLLLLLLLAAVTGKATGRLLSARSGRTLLTEAAPALADGVRGQEHLVVVQHESALLRIPSYKGQARIALFESPTFLFIGLVRLNWVWVGLACL